jgi:acyl transferase domain-containing protein
LPEKSGTAELLRSVTFGSRHRLRTASRKPACIFLTGFVFNLALARLWMSLGVTPAAVVGHGPGELVSACVAGVFSIGQALRIARFWGQYADDVAVHAAAALIACPASEIRQRLGEDVLIAMDSAPDSCVAVGRSEAVARLVDELRSRDLGAEVMSAKPYARFAGADACVDELADMLAAMEPSAPSIPMMSAVDGEWIDGAKSTSPVFWLSQLCGAVRWAGTMQRLQSELEPIWLRFGADDVRPAASRTTVKAGAGFEHGIGSHDRHIASPEPRRVYEGVASLWLKGARIDWTRFHQNENNGRVPLPTYPFERHRHWADAEPKIAEPVPVPDRHVDGLHGLHRQPHLSRNQLIRAKRTRHGSGDAADAAGKRAQHAPTALHSAIGKMWGNILGGNDFGIYDDFFKMGGDSIMIIDLLEQINATFNVDLPVFTLFESPTIDELANLVGRIFNDAEGLRARPEQG